MFALEMPHASDLPDLDLDDTDPDLSAESDDLFESQMGTAPPVPQLGAKVMAEYRPFIEIYSVCSAQKGEDRPSAGQCCELFRPLCPPREEDGQ